MLQQLKLGSSKLNSRIIADTVASRSRSRQGRQEEGSKGAEGELGMAEAGIMPGWTAPAALAVAVAVALISADLSLQHFTLITETETDVDRDGDADGHGT